MGGRLKVKYEKYNPEDCELHGKQCKCVITDDPLPKDYPKREHWLIRLVNDYVDGKISSIHEFVEQYKEQKDETEI